MSTPKQSTKPQGGKKAREWWIRQHKMANNISSVFNTEPSELGMSYETINVVEKLAYQKAIDGLRDVVDSGYDQAGHCEQILRELGEL